MVSAAIHDIQPLQRKTPRYELGEKFCRRCHLVWPPAQPELIRCPQCNYILSSRSLRRTTKKNMPRIHVSEEGWGDG